MKTTGIDNSRSFAQEKSTHGVVATEKIGVKEGMLFGLLCFISRWEIFEHVLVGLQEWSSSMRQTEDTGR